MDLFKEVIRKYLKMIILYIILGVIITFINIYSIDYLQKVLNAFQDGNLTISIIAIYAAILFVFTILGYVDNYPAQKLENGLYLEFKLQTLKKMKTIKYTKYQKLGTGRLIQRVEEGSRAACEMIFSFWLKIIRQIIPTAIFSLGFIFLIEKKILFFILLGYVVVIIVTNIILKRLYLLKEKILVNQENLNKYLVRGFMELVVFRVNKKYDIEIKKTNDGIANIVNSKTKIKMIHEIFFTVFALLVCILKIVVLIYAFFTKDLTVGALVTLFTLIGKAFEPIAVFNVLYIDYKLNKIATKRYVDLLDLEDDESLYKGEEINYINGKIEFKDVNFSYSNKKVLNNLSFKIENNEVVAFVGESGSGKSTIIKQIMGLIKPNSGNIFIDKYNLNNINLSKYYNFVSYVTQESPIFDGTLRENIVFDKEIEDSKIIDVLKEVCLEDFYLKLEKGLDTELGEKGITMSGGERQRVAIARLFFENSKIIILDEATSALDYMTEKEVMNKIIKKLTNRTIIIITHRLETIKDANSIFVLENGKILETGNFETLIKEDDYFRKLYTVTY